VPCILYGDSSSEVMYDDPPCHSWAPEGDPCADVGTSFSLVDSRYVSSYADHLFDGSSSGFPDNQYGKFVRSMYDAFDYDLVILFYISSNANA